VVERLPSKCKALSSTPSTAKKEKKKIDSTSKLLKKVHVYIWVFALPYKL
jgi:hypothetical protein